MLEIIIDGNENFGINYYHESMGYASWSDADLIKIKKVTDKIKLFKHPYGRNDYILEICQKCKELGFYVILTENFDGNHYAPPYSPGVPYIPYKLLTEEYWLDYCNYVKADYEVLKDYVDEFLVSNEILDHTDGTDGMIGQNMIDKVAVLKNELVTIQDCIFGIQVVWWRLVYNNYDFSAFNELYYTNYHTEFEDFKSFLGTIKTKYPNSKVGEWNIGLHPTFEDWNEHSKEIKERKDWLKEQGISNFVFTYNAGKHSVNGNEVFPKLAKTIHYCDHDQKIRSGCVVKLEDI